jgi:hypothetical protein
VTIEELRRRPLASAVTLNLLLRRSTPSSVRVRSPRAPNADGKVNHPGVALEFLDIGDPPPVVGTEILDDSILRLEFYLFAEKGPRHRIQITVPGCHTRPLCDARCCSAPVSYRCRAVAEFLFSDPPLC